METQIKVKTTEPIMLTIRPTQTGVEIDTYPFASVGLDLASIDQVVETLQAQAARVRALSHPGQMGLFEGAN